MRAIKTIFYFCIISLFITSCDNNDDNGEYKGKNELFISVDKSTVLDDSEDGKLTLNLMLTKATDKDVIIKFSIKNNEYNNISIASFTESTTLIKAGEKQAQAVLQSNNKGILTSEHVIEIGTESISDNNIQLNKTVLITVKPGIKSVVLTEEQVKLIEGYKKNGIDISKWIGLIPVTVKITYPGQGNFAPFLDRYERTVQGKTAITLSSNATSDKIILKMTNNAMGIENYLYEILMAETILNTEFWTPQPAPQMTINLTGLNKDRAETFNLALDNLELNTSNSTVSFVCDNVVNDTYGTEITAVNFAYSYSAWDRLKKLIDEKNQDAIDANAEGGTIYPGYILNHSGIDTDGWEGASQTWIKPTSSFNTSTGEMKFTFNMDHTNAAGYILFEVTYSPIK